MSQFTEGVHYELPAYASGPAPTAPMGSRSNQAQEHLHTDSNMDPNLGNMDSDITQLIQPTQRDQYQPELSQSEDATYQLQLQAAAATEAANASSVNHSGNFSGQASPATATPKAKRLGRACDACSKRKVKCGEEAPCKNCVNLNVQCTFNRPTKRRGPSNKLVDDLKRLRSDDGHDSPFNGQLSLVPVPFTIESIAPFDTVHRLIYDFFTYLYPIFPFPPEAMVLNRLTKREDQTNKNFLALIASMLALLASAYPQLLQRALPDAQIIDGVIHTTSDVDMAFVKRCTDICLQSRSSVRGSSDVDDAATSFFLAMSSSITGSQRHFSGHAADSLSLVESLGVLQPRVDGTAILPVVKELSLRIFWAIYVATRAQAEDFNHAQVISPRKTSELPELPVLPDDIYTDNLGAQSQDKFLIIRGFNDICRIYSAGHALINYTLLDDDLRPLVHEAEVAAVQNCFQELDALLSTTHPDLSSLPALGYFESLSDSDLLSSPNTRVRIRTEILKIYIRTHLIVLRLHFTDRFSILHGLDPTMLSQDTEPAKFIAAQYGAAIKDLAALLRNVSPISLEPCAKIVAPLLQNAFKTIAMCPKGIEQAPEDYEYLIAQFAVLFGST